MSFQVILVYPPHLRPIQQSPCYTPVITHHSETNMHNIANLPQDEKDKINADLAASGIEYKERLGLPYDLYETENQQPEYGSRSGFLARVAADKVIATERK